LLLIAPSIGKWSSGEIEAGRFCGPARARSQTGGVNKIVVRHLAAEPKRAAVAVAKLS
jgi:hypothetical protein